MPTGECRVIVLGGSPARGFGITRTLLAHAGPPAKHPWLTVTLLDQEAAIDDHLADPEAVFMASIGAGSGD